MNANWIQTNEIYHQIINAPDMAKKEQLYREHILAPWQNMMQMMGGMAKEDSDEFAAALFGEEVVGYYVTDFDKVDLDTARALIQEGLEKTGFNVIRGYIFGDSLADDWGFQKVGMPDYGGYAIGYRVVQAYLQRTGTSIEEATFQPAMEIVQASGYLD